MNNPNYTRFTGLFEFLKEAGASFNEKDELILFPEKYEAEFAQRFPGLTAYETSRGQVRLDMNQTGFPLFWSDRSFLERAQPSDFNRDIGVLNLEDHAPRFFDQASQTGFLNFEKAEQSHFFRNAHAYFQLLDFLEKKNEHAKGE